MTTPQDTRRHTPPDQEGAPPLDPPLDQSTDLANAKQQEEYRQRYLEQLRRRLCPGCGDDGAIPF